MVEKTLFELVTKISQEATSFTKFSVAMQLKAATVAWAICQKLSRDIIKKSHQYHVTKDQNEVAEKNQKGTVKLTT